MNNISLEEMLKLADENLANTIRHRIVNSKNGKLYENEGYMIYTIGVDNEDGHINGVLCLDDNYAKEALEKAEEFFNPIKRDYVVWVRGHGNEKLEMLLQGKGLEPKRKPGSAGMVIKNKIDSIVIGSSFEVKHVNDTNKIKDFSIIVKQAFDKSSKVVEEVFTEATMLASDNTKAIVIYQKGIPVSAVSMTIKDNVGGLYWVGTVENARGQGLGSYITQLSTNIAFDEGAKAVVLQASAAGERVYEKLGYETITRYRWYGVNF